MRYSWWWAVFNDLYVDQAPMSEADAVKLNEAQIYEFVEPDHMLFVRGDDGLALEETGRRMERLDHLGRPMVR